MIESPLTKFNKRGRERYEACDDEGGEMKKQGVSRRATSKRDDYVSEGKTSAAGRSADRADRRDRGTACGG